MKILKSQAKKYAQKWIYIAAATARRSGCLRSKCGAVIVKNNKILATGFNSPPQHKSKFRTCLNEYKISAGFRHDRTCCIHAEQRAIADAKQKPLAGAIVYFARLDIKGNLEKEKSFKCTICSRALLDAHIRFFVMSTKRGIVHCTPEEMDRESYKHKTPRIT